MDEQKPPQDPEEPFSAFDVPGKGWRCGPYRLQDLLGAGAQGEVYAAVHLTTGEQVAVKVLTRLLRESNQLTIPLLQGSVGSLSARAQERQVIEEQLKRDLDSLEQGMGVYMPRLVSLRHPNLVSILGWGRKGNYIWIAMERIQAAKSLDWHIMKERRQQNQGPASYDSSRLTTKRAATIVRDISSAVHALHQNGLIHRDIKPANILVDESSRCVLTDLELVGVMAPDGFVRGFPGDFFGTPGYAAPESLLARPGTVGVRSDVYCLGTLLYELVSLERPVRRLSYDDFASGRYGDPPLRPELAENGRSRVDTLLSSIIMRCLHTRPRWRYASASAVGQHLSEYLKNELGRARRFEMVRSGLRWAYCHAQRDPRIVAATVVFAHFLFGIWYALVEIPAVEETIARICATDGEEAIAASIAYEHEANRVVAEAKRRFRSSIHTRLAQQLLDPVVHVAPGVNVWGMQRRVSAIQDLKRGFASQGRQRWEEVLSRLSNDPLFSGYRIEVDPDLMPLGPDPVSQLEEFALPTTGSIPQRLPDGSLVCEDEACIVLVLVPPGSYDRGQPKHTLPDDSSIPVESLIKAAIDPVLEGLIEDPDIIPAVKIKVDPFYISKWEVTQAQYGILDQEHKSAFLAGVEIEVHGGLLLEPPIGRRNPVENVTWSEAQVYCSHFGLELPSESRWEYAAHGGIPGRWPNPADGYDVGPLLAQKAMNSMDRSFMRAQPTAYDRNPLDHYDDGTPFHCAVDMTWQNAFGLGGMLGNVYEYCADLYSKEAHLNGPDQDANEIGSITGARSVRGGSFRQGPGACSCTARWSVLPDWPRDFLGFRPMRRANWELTDPPSE
jgi:serine/threonine protein kinase/formylglycine-generating enzyme required for sulfatase activity